MLPTIRNFYRPRQLIFLHKNRFNFSKLSSHSEPEDTLDAFIKSAKANDESACEQLLLQPDFVLPIVKNGTDTFGNSPLMLCAQRNWADGCKMLIDLNCNADHQNVFGSTALMCSAAQGHLDALQVLLSSESVTVNLCSRFGQTALMKAILAGREESVKMLLEKGAAIDVVNKQGKSALDLAHERGHPHIISRLLRVIETKKSPDGAKLQESIV